MAAASAAGALAAAPTTAGATRAAAAARSTAAAPPADPRPDAAEVGNSGPTDGSKGATADVAVLRPRTPSSGCSWGSAGAYAPAIRRMPLSPGTEPSGFSRKPGHPLLAYEARATGHLCRLAWSRRDRTCAPTKRWGRWSRQMTSRPPCGEAWPPMAAASRKSRSHPRPRCHLHLDANSVSFAERATRNAAKATGDRTRNST